MVALETLSRTVVVHILILPTVLFSSVKQTEAQRVRSFARAHTAIWRLLSCAQGSLPRTGPQLHWNGVQQNGDR